jgi:hypothetical protein
MFNLTDMEALDQLEFNLQWHHALALTAEEAHLCVGIEMRRASR